MQYMIYTLEEEDDWACTILAKNPFDAALQYCEHFVSDEPATTTFEIWNGSGEYWLAKKIIEVELNSLSVTYISSDDE